MSLSRTQIVNWLLVVAIFSAPSEYLTGLDREIGDADHGLNMNRGFSKVVEKLLLSQIKISVSFSRIPA